MQCTRRRLKIFTLLALVKLAVVYFLFYYHPIQQSPSSVAVRGTSGGGQQRHRRDRDGGQEGGTLDPAAVAFKGQSLKMLREAFHVKAAVPLATLVETGNTAKPELRATIILAGDHGQLVWKLFPDDAPKTVANFIKLAKNKIYDGTSLYRYEAGFCLQGGGWPKKSSPYGLIPLEYKLPNKKFAISMARTAQPNTAAMEFSIMLNDNSKWLGPGGSDPYGYAVFAEVVEGRDVIEKLGHLATKKQGLTLFVDPVRIQTVIISGEDHDGEDADKVTTTTDHHVTTAVQEHH